jgi:hypothetical protein
LETGPASSNISISISISISIWVGNRFSAVNLANATPVRVNFSSGITDHILRAGVNYRFGGPVVAKY